MNALLAIGITTRDRWPELEKTLTHIASYGLTDVETVVIDDSSTTPMPSDWMTRFPWVRFERSAKPLGYIAQRNHLARILRAKFYLSLDDDSYPVLGDLSAAVHWLGAHPEVIALAFRVWESEAAPAVADSGEPYPVRFYIGCAHLLHREEFLRLGGYRQELESYCEEFEFSVRAWKSGRTVMAWPAVVFRHERSTAGRNLHRINRLLTRNDLWIAMWHYPWFFLVLSLLNCLPRQFRYACHREYWRAVLRGYLAAFTTFPFSTCKRSAQSARQHLDWRRLPHPGTLVEKSAGS